MSRGPGRVMRVAIAELDERGHTSPYGIAARIKHDRECGCDDGCDPALGWRPSRSQLVSARRALHALERRGDVALARVQNAYESGWTLAAVKCCVHCELSVQATLTSRHSRTVAYRDVRDAAKLARSCCASDAVMVNYGAAGVS